MTYQFDIYYDFVNELEHFKNKLNERFPLLEKPAVIYDIAGGVDMFYRTGYNFEFSLIPNVRIILGYMRLINSGVRNKNLNTFAQQLKDKYEKEALQHESNIIKYSHERENVAKFCLYNMRKILKIIESKDVNLEAVYLHEQSVYNYVDEFKKKKSTKH